MSEYLLLLLGTALVNNVVLVKFLGLCPFMGVSKKLDSALSMGLATTFVLTLAAMTSWILEHFILAPFNIQFLRILAFILVIAAVVQFTEMVVHKTSPVLYQILGIFLPLITTNCAVLGVALLNVQEKYGFIDSLIFYFEHPDLVNPELLILKIKELILLLLQSDNYETIAELISNLFSPRQANLKDIIQNHLFSDLSVTELAKLANLSLSSFKREFQNFYNDTPANYLRTKKIEKAMDLLTQSDLSVS